MVRQRVIGEPPNPICNVAPKRAEIGRCMPDKAREHASDVSHLAGTLARSAQSRVAWMHARGQTLLVGNAPQQDPELPLLVFV